MCPTFPMEGERERPTGDHLAPSLRQVDVSAEASPTRKEEKKARTRKERNCVSSKYTYQERAGQEKKKRRKEPKRKKPGGKQEDDSEARRARKVRNK